jgi:hypothetical protein
VSVYFNKLDCAVFFTLAYSDYFNFPLIKTEIKSRLPRVWDWQFLTGQKVTSTELKINKEKIQLENSLNKLLKAKKIEKLKSNNLVYYFLKDRKELVGLRASRKRIASKRQGAIDEFLNLVSFLPSIRAVVLTGSSAVDNAEINDDLDFCLITKKNTLWISRFFLIFIAKILGKRPQIDIQSKADSKQAWCFNLWLDENYLDTISRSFSIYQAYEVKQMRWLTDKKNLKNIFLSKNKQLDEFVQLDSRKTSYKKNNAVFNYFLWPINLFFYYLQNFYRYLFFGKENYCLSPYQAHFNEASRQEDIFLAIKKKMKENGFSTL